MYNLPIIEHMYTIICTQNTYGQIIETKPKEEVKKECERLQKIFSNKICENTYTRIEVINNDTGEIREYWNNKENTINF